MPSFKVPCPSCEAQVLIKNPNLIGTKVECPKCKYRFKVEEPASDSPAGEEKKPKKEDKPKAKKPKGKSKAPAVLIAIGVLILVGGVGYAILGGKKKTAGTSRPPVVNQNNAGTPDEGDQNKEEKPPEKPKPKYTIPLSDKDPTNLLHGQSIAVYRFNMDQVQHSPLFSGVFEANAELFKASMGFPAEDVSAYYHCVVGSDRGSFGVLRTSAPRTAKELASKMALEPNPKTVNNRVLHTIKSNPFVTAVGQTFAARSLLGDVYETMPGKPAGPPKPAGVCFYDNNTILLGDLAVVDQYLAGLQANGYPEFKGALVGADGKADGKGVLTTSDKYLSIDVALKRNLLAVDADPQNPPMIVYAELLAPGEYDAKKFRKEYKPIGDVLDPILVRAKSVGANLTEFSQKKLTATVRIVTGTDSEAREVVLQHLTPGLQAALPPLSLLFGTLIELRDGTTPQPGGMQPGGYQPPGGVPPRGGPGGETGSSDGPPPPPGGGSMSTPPRGQINLGGGTSAGGPGTSAGGQPPRGGMTPPPGMMPGTSSSGQPPGTSAGGLQPPTGPTPPTSQNQSFVELQRVDNTVTFTVELFWSEDVYRRTLNPRLVSLSNQTKGKMAVYAASYGLHPLADAVKAYTAQYKAFPRGTSPTPVHVGVGLPYPPQKRLSFYRELLPFMDRSKSLVPPNSRMGWAEEKLLSGTVDKETGEKSADAEVDSNIQASGNWVPELLVPYYPPTAWRATSPLAPDKVFGGTNFVAIAGLGAEAARMDPADPAAAKKVGITGYAWGSKTDEVTDGLDKTIYLMQVPPGLSRPWAAGGGATIMGVNEQNPMADFAYPRPDGERGAHAIMGDGTIRWIPEKIDPKVFMAMATRAGGEALPANLDQLCPKVEVKKMEEPKLVTEVPPVGKTPPVTGPDNVAPAPREKGATKERD